MKRNYILLAAIGSCVLAAYANRNERFPLHTAGSPLFDNIQAMPYAPDQDTMKDRTLWGVMHSMKQSMQNLELTEDPDIDYARMMQVHNEASLQMSRLQVEEGRSEELKRVAREVLSDARRDSTRLEEFLRDNSPEAKSDFGQRAMMMLMRNMQRDTTMRMKGDTSMMGEERDTSMMMDTSMMQRDTSMMQRDTSMMQRDTGMMDEPEMKGDTGMDMQMDTGRMHKKGYGRMQQGNIDMQYARMMMQHHRRSMELSQLYLKSAKKSEMKNYANQIMRSTREDIARLRKWQDENRGLARQQRSQM